jgi:hypothetical protein
MIPGKMIMLEIGGQLVTVVVEHEQLEDLAAYGYPAERAVYVTHWNDLQIDDTPTCRTGQPAPGDARGRPRPRPRMDRADRPLAPADRGQRAVGVAA